MAPLLAYLCFLSGFFRLDTRVYFFPMHSDLRRSGDTYADMSAFYAQYGNADVIADIQAFAGPSVQH